MTDIFNQLKAMPRSWLWLALTGLSLTIVCICSGLGMVFYLSPGDTPPTLPAVAETGPSQIAFVYTTSRQGGEYDLYVMEPDGSNRRQLTALPGLETAPAWSPDGRRVAFVATQDSLQPNACATGYPELTCNFEIYTIDLDGQNLTRLTNLPSYEREPAWSPDGQRIAFSSREGGASFGYIYLVNPDGSDLTALTSGEVRDTGPTWSPDGQRIAFTRESCCESQPYSTVDIYVMAADGSNVTRLTDGQTLNANPAWSPDGRQIAWMTLEGEGEAAIGRIGLMNADGTEQHFLPLDLAVPINYPPTWSPDSQQLMFVYREGNGLDLYRANLDGSNLTKVTDGSAFFSAPAWSPVLTGP